MATITGIDLGTVTKERIELHTNFMKFGLAAGDASNNVLLNLGGKRRTMVIEGLWTGTTGFLKAYIDDMNEWVNQEISASIQATKTYTPTLNPADGPYTVNCEEFNYDYVSDGDGPAIVRYSIKLIQGSLTGQ